MDGQSDRQAAAQGTPAGQLGTTVAQGAAMHPSRDAPYSHSATVHKANFMRGAFKKSTNSHEGGTGTYFW